MEQIKELEEQIRQIKMKELQTQIQELQAENVSQHNGSTLLKIVIVGVISVGLYFLGAYFEHKFGSVEEKYE